MIALRIEDKDDRGFLLPTLHDLLEILEPYGCKLTWAMTWLDATGQVETVGGVLALGQHASQWPRGVVLSWSELVALARAFWQVRDGMFAGYPDAQAIPLRADVDSDDSAHLLIEAVDCSYWIVSARDAGAIDALKAAFRSTTVIT